MGMREKITDAVYDHPGAPAIIDAVMEVVEGDAERRRAYTERRVENARQVGRRDGETEAHQAMAEAAPNDDLELIRGRVGDMLCGPGWDLQPHEVDQTTADLIGCVSDVLGAKHTRVRELEEENQKLWDAAVVTRYVATHWRDAAMRNRWAASHPLALVLSALDGETNPEQLGLPEDEHAALSRARQLNKETT